MNKIGLFKYYKVGAFSVLLTGVFLSLLYYNILSVPLLEKRISIKYQEIIDITKRFHGYYINANEIQLNEGIHDINNVGIIVNKTGTVKVLSPAITLLYQSLSEVIDNKYLWTIAVIEKLHDQNTGNSYFKPLRDNYVSFNDKSLHDSLMLDRIVKLENIEERYKGFHEDDIRVTEVYKEQWTSERINSIIYPIYLDTRLVSLVIVDIKEGLNDCIVEEFNESKWVFINNKPGLGWFTFNINRPYTAQDIIHSVSINIVDVFLVSLYITITIFFLAFFLYYCYLKIEMIRRCDRMTSFYRRDYYDLELDQLENTHVLMVDIDNFKYVNDTHGHDVGDSVIKEVTRRLRNNIRTEDIAIRWGGEEFVIIFFDMNQSDFAKKSEALRLCIESILIKNMAITISLGGVEQKKSELMIDAIQRADIALYESKASGRNQVTIHKNEYGEE
ncbi:GGDEF domain-containing protein [Aliivibrio sifiae]|uniref:diguanylate cyclase n=1 Tax=Aliivibrio sifiae TaxID=566293 RepID=A0A2S7X6T9_9GAMM|nr:GGDEF domain-containing protein [Aliivibrio sifiae]PQJ87007.1 GGDEF domain-containing protein [Aliivibrio sifiae]GLR73862.1 GGDEF domain-containing protein [Aliivibrio sifiae]